MIRNTLVLAGFLCISAHCANAAELSYSYFEVGAARSSPDALDSANGLGVHGSVSVGETFHLFGGYERTAQSLANISRTRIGVGYRHPVAATSDLFARISVEHGDFDGLGRSNGYGAEVGLRGAVGADIELSASLRFTDMEVASGFSCLAIYPLPAECQFRRDENGDNTSFNLQAIYTLSAQWGLSTGASFSETENRFFVAARRSF